MEIGSQHCWMQLWTSFLECISLHLKEEAAEEKWFTIQTQVQRRMYCNANFSLSYGYRYSSYINMRTFKKIKIHIMQYWIVQVPTTIHVYFGSTCVKLTLHYFLALFFAKKRTKTRKEDLLLLCYHDSSLFYCVTHLRICALIFFCYYIHSVL